jgi:hypothetical protein
MAELLLLFPRNHEGNEPHDIGLLETQTGLRARLTASFNTESGIARRRFEDLSSGWRAEFRQDLGMENLGDPGNYADPFQWVLETEERRRKAQRPSGYALETSDGVFVEWEEPWDTGSEELQARREALVELAAALYEQPPPDSVSTELHLLSQFLGGQGASDADTFNRLSEILVTALRVADDTERAVEPVDLEVDSAPPGARRERVAELVEAAKASGTESAGAATSTRQADPPECAPNQEKILPTPEGG